MLVGRDQARAVVASVLAAARAGTGTILLVRGEPGIGKSALLDDAVAHASDVQVLRTRGLASESALAYAGLSDLLRPVLSLMDQVPRPQAEALASALSLGPPVAADRFTIYAGTLSLLSAAAEAAPLLVLVDDVHWLDRPSTEAILFAGRRLRQEGFGLVLASRGDDEETFDSTGLEVLHLAGLDRAGTDALLRLHVDKAVDPAVAADLHRETVGNPLGLIESVSILRPAQLTGQEPLPNPMPERGVERAFLRRVTRLPDGTRAALKVAALAGSVPLDVMTDALSRLGLDRAALDVAEDEGLVSIGEGRLEFGHPLMRSAVYHGSSAVERREAHRALAEALHGTNQEERRAWHLAESTAEPSEQVAQALAQIAGDAIARGGHFTAADTFERAARLTPQPALAARRLVAAAHATHLAGRSVQALDLLEEAETTADDETLSDIHLAKGAIQTVSGGPIAAQELLVAEAERIEHREPAKAAAMLIQSAIASFMSGRITTAVVSAQRARTIAPTGPLVAAAEAVLSHAMLLAGEPERARALVSGLPTGAPAAFDPSQWQAIAPVAQMCTWLEQYGVARALAARTIHEARSRSILAPLPYLLAVVSEIDFRTGDWARARAGAAEAVDLAVATEQENILVFCLVTDALVDAGRGSSGARAKADRAVRIADRVGVGSIPIYATAALGLLELGLGNLTNAISHLEETRGRVELAKLGHPTVVQWAPDLVEAYLMVGRVEDAAELLESFVAVAERTSSPWAQAAAGRCRGLLAGDASFSQPFEAAMALHAMTHTPFEAARTELSYGERLLRSGHAADARPRLRSALTTFEGLGAAPWAARAREGLRATGVTVTASRTYSTVLTAQELQVALVVAEGATNREAAAALFLSPKTIEFHLGNVYRKLGVRSRSELTRLVLTSSGFVASGS